MLFQTISSIFLYFKKFYLEFLSFKLNTKLTLYYSDAPNPFFSLQHDCQYKQLATWIYGALSLEMTTKVIWPKPLIL